MAKQHKPGGSIKGTALSSEYTVILRADALEFYQTTSDPWEKRDTPDFLLTAEETEGLFDFLLLVLPPQHTQTTVFETE